MAYAADATMTGLVTAVYDIGCAFGAVGAFMFGERLGRKRCIILAQIIGNHCFETSKSARLISVSGYWCLNSDRILQLRSNVCACKRI